MHINRVQRILGIRAEEDRNLIRAEIKILLGCWPDRI